jgi:two-component system, cell cycle sensor histidine kinase and response regulator CckA
MESETRYRQLFTAVQDGILLLDAQTGAITDVNPFLANLLGYTHAELLGKPLWEIGLCKDVEVSQSRFRELVKKQYTRYEDLALKTRDGLIIDVEFVSKVYRVKGANVVQCNVHDIRRRKDAEQSEQRLRQAHKMEAVGQLAGGLAHDFNNLLGVILGYCEILQEQAALPASTRKMISEIHAAGSSARNLTRRLLAFSRRRILQPVVLDLNATVNQMQIMLGRLIGDDTELVSLLGRDLGTIRADPNQMEQVLMNLVINARDAMPEGGRISVETANVEIDEIEQRQYPFIPAGRYARLMVSDMGSGIDMETQAHIFEPFFSTKAAGKGTGLGLSTVLGIVKQSGGAIAVSSKPGEGTAFKIYFPRCDEPPAALQPAPAKAIGRGTETILLVDDAAPLRQLTRRLLQDSGYKVLDSGDPAEALRMAGEYPGPLPLMITDLFMPGFSGSVLARKIAPVHPETKVLYASGYDDNSLVQLGVCGQDYAFLEKPFTRDDLLRKVREVLDSPLLPLPGSAFSPTPLPLARG